jgi:Uma2 family endonuclease
MATIQATAENRLLMHGVRWQTYEMLVADLGESHIRLTYDKGELELMSPSREHESYKCLIGRMIESLTEELDIEIDSGGSTTFKREDLDRGLEPDACFWIDKELLIRGKMEIDLALDPPPDLPMADVAGFLHRGTSEGETSWIKSFRGWVRSDVLPRAKGPANG